MPQIPGYEDHIAAQGAIGVRASAADFGGQIGEGMQRFGGGLQDAGDAAIKITETQDVTNVHVNMAKARAEWTKTLQDRENSATPGDDSFAPTLMKDIDEWAAKGMESVQTARGRQVYQSLAANMSSEFGQRAIEIQSQLAAKDAVNKYDLLKTSSGSTVFADQSQLSSVIAQGKAAIDDPSGIFGRVPAPVRDKFKQQIEQDVKFAAAKGFVAKHPEAVLQSMSPEQLALFKPWQNIIDANTAPSGAASIAPETLAKASDFVTEASAKALNPNILMAQNDANETKQAPKDQAATMSVLVNKYGGDYSKALAAYNMGGPALDAVLDAHGSDWLANVPDATEAYVNQVLIKSGAVASAAPKGPAVDEPVAVKQEPASSSLPFLNGLTWEQQDHIVKEGVQLQHMRMTMAVHAREEQKRQLEESQKTVMDGFLKQIVEPSKFGRVTEDTILKDTTLAWNQKQHMIDYMFTRQRELKASADSKTNPEEVRRLLLQVYANPNDPNKTYSTDPTMESYKLGRLNTNEMMLIRREVDALRDGSTSNFQKTVQNASNVVHDAFTKSIEGSLQPEIAAEGWYRFRVDMDQQIQAKREKNEDPRILLDPGSRDYLLKPERLRTFMTGAKTAVASAAKTITDQQKLTLPTYKDFSKLKKGESFIAPDGRVLVKTKD